MGGYDPRETPLTDFLIEVARDGEKALRFADNPERFLDEEYPTLPRELRDLLLRRDFGAINDAVSAENEGNEETSDYYAALWIFRPINRPVVPINTTPEDEDEDEDDGGKDDGDDDG